MAAHASSTLLPSPDPGGIERGIARRMPALALGAAFVVLVIWWMAAQPPPGPGWGDPNAPQQQPWPQQGQGQGQGQQPVPPPSPSSGCSMCVGLDCADCLSGIDCADCIDCGDCLSGLDCSCAVAKSPVSAAAPVAATARSCSTNPWRRLVGSSGLLLPLLVMVGWRRRLRR